MYWLKSISIRDHFCAPDFDVDLVADGATEPRHLVLTGPNGSGKTTILDAITQKLKRYDFPKETDNQKLSGEGPTIATVHWYERPTRDDWTEGSFLLTGLSHKRTLNVVQPTGPTTMSHSAAKEEAHLSPQLLQFLVNQQVQARLAKEDEPEASQAIFAWFATLEEGLASLFGLPSLTLRFDRHTYSILFVEKDGREYTFDQLPSGFASALGMLAELILRVDARGLERGHPSGVVIIDEIDAFLHPALQERIMPFLTSMFPRIQFLIATHSPAVATSMRNATVVALASGYSFDAQDLVGTPYGQLLTTLFGIPTDVDLETTKELEHLKRLTEQSTRSDSEEQEYRDLALRLQRTNNPVALEAYTRILMQDG